MLRSVLLEMRLTLPVAQGELRALTGVNLPEGLSPFFQHARRRNLLSSGSSISAYQARTVSPRARNMARKPERDSAMKVRLNYTDRYGNRTSTDGEALAKYPLVAPPADLTLNLPEALTAVLLLALGRALDAHYALQDVGIQQTTLDTSKGIDVIGGDGPTGRLFGLCAAIRPFMLNDDQLCFPKLVKTVQRLDGAALKDWGRSLRVRWENAAFGSSMRLQIGDVRIDSKTILDSYFNNRTFHTKPQKNDIVPFCNIEQALGGQRQAASFVFWLLRDHLLLVFRLLHDVAGMSSRFKATVEERLTD